MSIQDGRLFDAGAAAVRASPVTVTDGVETETAASALRQASPYPVVP